MNPTILSIDDNEANQQLLAMSLTGFNLLLAMHGEEGVLKAQENKPDLILLDINMQGLNGYEVCKKLKEDPITEHIPVVFLSAMNSLDDRINSYKAGGDDYIPKPFDILELKHKMRVLLAYQNHFNELKKRLKTASNVAITAMNNSSEMGVIIAFVTQSISSSNAADIAENVLAALSTFQLNGSLAIRTENHQTRYYSNTLMSPLETQLLNTAKDSAHVVSLGKRAIFTTDTITLLIKDMPAEDADKCGRLRDHLAILASCADARIKGLIHAEISRQYRSSKAAKLLGDISLTVEHVTEKVNGYQTLFKQSHDDFCVNLETEVVGFMLPEAEEHRMLKLLEHYHEHFGSVLDVGSDLNDMLKHLTDDLKSISKY